MILVTLYLFSLIQNIILLCLILNRLFLILFLSVSCLLISLPYASACTVWGAAGEKVKIKGTVIAKNRDNAPHLFSSPRLSFPVNGYKFFGLYDIEADGFVIAGINEKHLAVFNASVTSVPKAKREVAKEDTTERLLMTFDSVDAVLLRKDIFEEAGNKVQEILFARPINEVCYGEKMTIAGCLMQRPSGELFVSVTTFNSKCSGGVIHDSKDVKALYFPKSKTGLKKAVNLANSIASKF